MANVGFDADGFISGDISIAVAVDTDADQSPFVYVNTTNKAVRFYMHLSDADILVRDDKYEEGQAYGDGYSFVLPPFQARVFYVTNNLTTSETIGFTIDTTVVRGANNVVGNVYVEEVN